jgi:benzoyl-CoA reductase/2-hydroxyglutaryl-CoA dehydratase subunit BcrC/BadD/HgdB
VEALVRYLYDNQAGGAAVHSREIIENEISKVKARGLVLYGYIGCSFASVDREMWRNYFHQKGIPSINLEGSYQTGAPTGQLMTRVKAFIEMLS